MSTDSNSSTKTKNKVDMPRKYKVIIFNDDFTTQEFVEFVLKKVFSKDATEAHSLTMKVHLSGSAVAGIYTKDIAESKADKATAYARDSSFPLMIVAEPE
jgi:ATP-dependent Clp protease adaptor protein ClpS